MTGHEKIHEEIGRKLAHVARLEAEIEGLRYALKVIGAPPAPKDSKPPARRRPDGAVREAVRACLDKHEPIRVGKLAAVAGLSRPTVSQEIHRMEREGLVQPATDGKGWVLTVGNGATKHPATQETPKGTE